MPLHSSAFFVLSQGLDYPLLMLVADTPVLDRAKALHQRSIVIDTHLDTTKNLVRPDWNFAERHTGGHVDIPRLREGGLSAVFLAVFAPGPMKPGAGVAAARQQIAAICAAAKRYPADLAFARTSEEVRAAKQSGRIAILLAIEGGYLIEDSIDILREYRNAGATYMTLTHGFHTTWADSAGIHEAVAPHHHGLTDFGREVVREMDRLGMMVDVSHVSDETFWDVMKTSTAPVVATHSSCRAVCNHRRNLTDDMIRAIAGSGGVVQINFSAYFCDPNFPHVDAAALRRWREAGEPGGNPFPDYTTPLGVLADHFEHALRLIGPNHVGIGSDFDGIAGVPDQMEHIGCLHNLTAELLARGWKEADLAPALGENILRVMDKCQSMA